MELSLIDYPLLKNWSHTDLAYITHDPALRKFYEYDPVMASFQNIIDTRQKFPTNRMLLANVLKKQYKELDIELPVEDQMLLSENTFTITTAHQPTLFTGPLFHIYKIASAIHLARELTDTLKGYNVVPLFVVNSEDHDWAEVNHLHLFGKKLEWERSSTGPSGRLTIDGLETLVQSVIDLFSNAPHLNQIRQLLHACLEKAQNYSQFHRLFLHQIFGHHGLVILDMDDIDLKTAFVPFMEKDIREQFSIIPVSTTQSELEILGFKPQAYCRPINLFYMTDEVRERIEPHENGVIRVESKIKYSIDEIVAELHVHPERFSPNVILRPIYEEFILPNLAYIGGGGEIAYWLERKSQFEVAGVPFPMLIRRNSLLLLDASLGVQLHKLGMDQKDILPDYDTIVKNYLRKNRKIELGFEGELEMVKNAYELLAAKAAQIDPTLAAAISAEQNKQIKQFEQLGSRIMRAEKQLEDTTLKKIQRLKEKLFPNNGLQERHENFLSFYSTYGAAMIEKLIEICDPLEERFIILQLEDQVQVHLQDLVKDQA